MLHLPEELSNTLVSALVCMENSPLIAFLPTLALLIRTWLLHKLGNRINGAAGQTS